jgi:hypothetical protein
MKRKINIDRPELSSEEIASRQDFSSVMKQLPKVTKPPIYKTGWFITTVASIAGIAIITTNFILNDENSTLNTDLATTTEAALANNSTQDLPSTKEELPIVEENDIPAVLAHNVSHSPIEEATEEEVISASYAPVDFTYLEEEVALAKIAYEQATADVANFKKQEPTAPKYEGNPDRQFILDVDPNDFPELAAYKNLLFEVEPNDPNFSPTVYTEEWEDIGLKSKVKGKSYHLSLYKGNVSKTFTVFPVFKGADYEIAMSKYNIEHAAYLSDLQVKLDEENKLKTTYEQKLAKLTELKNQETDLSKTN